MANSEATEGKTRTLLIGPPAYDTINVIPAEFIKNGALHVPTGSKVPVLRSDDVLGGNIFNTTRHLARWGDDVTFAWNVGSKHYDKVIQALTEFMDVDTSMIGESGSIGQSTIMTALGGESDRVVFREGFAERLDDATQAKLISAVDDYDIVHTSALNDNNFLLDIAEEAASKNKIVSLSPTSSELAKPASLRRVVRHLSFLACNKEEAGKIFPEALDDLSDASPHEQLEALARAAHNLMVHDGKSNGLALISDGKNGLVAADGEFVIVCRVLYPESDQRPRLSSLGTGDAMTSGTLHKTFIEKTDLRSSIHFANASATHVLGDLGASESSFPLKSRLRKLLIESKPF